MCLSAAAAANDPVQLSLDAFGILPHASAACSQLEGLLEPPSPLVAATVTADEAFGSAAGASAAAAAEACGGSSLLLQDNTQLVQDSVQQAAAPRAPLVPAPQMLQAVRCVSQPLSLRAAPVVCIQTPSHPAGCWVLLSCRALHASCFPQFLQTCCTWLGSSNCWQQVHHKHGTSLLQFLAAQQGDSTGAAAAGPAPPRATG